MNTGLALSRNKLRKELRQRRRDLPINKKKFASQRITAHLERSGWLRAGKRIAVYLATPEELDLQPLIRRAWHLGCRLFVPQIISTRQKTMTFHPFNSQTQLATHQWGMQQPANTHLPVATRTLDAVLIPTVGFDRSGHRLGMGGGFYDRHFAYFHRSHNHKPFLIGVAYACQEVPAIEAQPYDVPLDAILTERGFLRL
jgi:5-formyltetrahydrofolate cyclo-ligase